MSKFKKAIICISLSLFTIVNIYAAEKNNYVIQVGKEELKFENEPILYNDKIYVSIRELCEKQGIPIIWDETNNKVILDVSKKKVKVSPKTVYKESGIVPDEETALSIGKTILEKYSDREVEYESENGYYYLSASYTENDDTWLVKQNFKIKNGTYNTGDLVYVPYIKLRKSTGEVVGINTYQALNY